MIGDHETPSVGSLTLRLSAMTHPGSLPSNEDACQVVRKDGASFVVLADGAGGHGYGEVASQVVVKSVVTYLDRLTELRPEPQVLEKALEIAQTALRDEITRSPKYYDMRSTGLVVMATRGRLWTGHVGDSRAYLIRDGKVTQLTRDDTLVQTLVDIGQLDREAAKKHSKANVLLQCLGEPRELEYHVSDPIEVHQGDVVLACSDGLSDVVPDKDLVELTRQGNSKEIAQRLIDRAVANGAPDNVTVSVILFRKRDAMPSIAAQRRAAPLPRRKTHKQKDSFGTVAVIAVLLTIIVLAAAVHYRRTHAARPDAPRSSDTPASVPSAPSAPASPAPPVSALPPVVAPSSGTTPAEAAPSPATPTPNPSAVAPATTEIAPAAPTTTAPSGPAPAAEAPAVATATSNDAAAMGRLQLVGLPRDAHVFVNDVEQTAPAGSELEVPANRRVRLRIHAHGYRDQLESVAVDRGSSMRVRVNLAPLAREGAAAASPTTATESAPAPPAP